MHPPNQNVVAVVGAGPAGLYVADELLRSTLPPRQIDIFDEKPQPYGLVRYGVAPDHPEVKLVSNKFQNEVLEDPAVSMFGNVKVGKGTKITLEKLMSCYDAVFLCHGSIKSKTLSLPSIDVETGKETTNVERGVLSAQQVVGWYNGEFAEAERKLGLETVKDIVVVGAGNVALDIARILLKKPESLEDTDITRHALAELHGSAVRSVSIVARRDVIHAAFATKELRELSALPEIHISVKPEDLSVEKAVVEKYRPLKRMMQLMEQLAKRDKQEHKREIRFNFCRSPKALLVDGRGNLAGLRTSVTKMVYEGTKGKLEMTDELEDLECQLLITSIGYETVSLDPAHAPVASDGSKLHNSNGRITQTPGLYVAGWAKRGPSGIVPNNKWDAAETVDMYVGDNIQHNDRKNGISRDWLLQNNLPVLDYKQMEKIEHHEKIRAKGKFTSIDEMLKCL